MKKIAITLSESMSEKIEAIATKKETTSFDLVRSWIRLGLKIEEGEARHFIKIGEEEMKEVIIP